MRWIYRIYLLSMSAISLQAATWAFVLLVGDTITSKSSVTGADSRVTVLVVGLLLYAIHWFARRRLRDWSPRERILRSVYNYGMLAAFLVPLILIALGLIASVISVGLDGSQAKPNPAVGKILPSLLQVIVLSSLFVCQWPARTENAEAEQKSGWEGTPKRVFVYGLSGMGLLLAASGATLFLVWALAHSSPYAIAHQQSSEFISDALAKLVLGLPLWLFFWTWAQRRLQRSEEEEQISIARRFYLYFVCLNAGFTGALVLSTVVGLTIGNIENSLRTDVFVPNPTLSNHVYVEAGPILIVLLPILIYHSFAYRRDRSHHPKTRRLIEASLFNNYCIKGISLFFIVFALLYLWLPLIEFSFGKLSVAQLVYNETFGVPILVISLGTWLVSRRRYRKKTEPPQEKGDEERYSIARQSYLHLLVLVAAILLFAVTARILLRSLSIMNGQVPAGNFLLDYEVELSLAILATGIGLPAAIALRDDWRAAKQARSDRLANTRVMIIANGSSPLTEAMHQGLDRQLPCVSYSSLCHTPSNQPAADCDLQDAVREIAKADFIVAPWNWARNDLPPEVAGAISASPARKLLIAFPVKGWEWLWPGMRDADGEPEHIVRAIRTVIDRQESQSRKLQNALYVLGGMVFYVMVLFSILVIGGGFLGAVN